MRETYRFDEPSVNINLGKVVRVHLVGHRVDVKRTYHLGHVAQPSLLQSVVLRCTRYAGVDPRRVSMECLAHVVHHVQ